MSENTKSTGGKALNALRQAVASDPGNLALAQRYWDALSCYEGHDVRRSRDAVQSFRIPAIRSSSGATALARALKELFEISGEPPRKGDFDAELIGALKQWHQQAVGDSRIAIDWLLTNLNTS